VYVVWAGVWKMRPVMDIIEFLEARIAEDEAAAGKLEAAASVPGGQSCPAAVGVISPFTASRVLAECAAKRKILGNVPLVTDNPAETGGTREYVLMCLAAVYRQHPDYQWGWSVDD
jgi:hypothetical protein